MATQYGPISFSQCARCDNDVRLTALCRECLGKLERYARLGQELASLIAADKVHITEYEECPGLHAALRAVEDMPQEEVAT